MLAPRAHDKSKYDPKGGRSKKPALGQERAESVFSESPQWDKLALSLAPGRFSASGAPNDPGAGVEVAIRAPGPTIQRQAADESPAIGEAGAAVAIFIADDGAAELSPGQMRKSEFLAEVHAAVCAEIEPVLRLAGQTSAGCPYLRAVFSFLDRQDAAAIDATLREFEPMAENATARDYIPAVAARVRGSAMHWVVTGEITGLPAGIPDVSELTSRWSGGEPELQFQSEPGARPVPADPRSIRARLGPGRALDGGAATRMRTAFGADFSRVRIHTDREAVSLSRSLRARAFTVGEHIAFGPGEYQPRTLTGEALLAHELAHTVQQGAIAAPARSGAGRSARRSLEADANESAFQAVATLWGRPDSSVRDASPVALPELTSGLRLQRCGESTREETPAPAPPVEEAEPEPTPEPRELLRPHVESALSDNRVTPAEWTSLREQAASFGVDDSDFRSLLGFQFDFGGPHDEVFALLATSGNSAIRNLASGYTATVSAPPRQLSPDPFPILLNQVMADSSFSREEFDALRDFNWMLGADTMRAELSSRNVTEPTLTSLVSILGLGFSHYQNVVSRPGFFPVRLQAGEGGALSSATDLRTVIFHALMTDSEWHHGEFGTVRAVLGGLSRSDAETLLQAAEIEATTAASIAAMFTQPEASYKRSVGDRTLLHLRFRREADRWRFTERTVQELALPWHPALIAPLAPVGGVAAGEQGTGTATTIESYSFASGAAGRADEISYTIRGHSFTLILAEALYEDPDLLDRIDAALSVIPERHLRLVRTLVLDPGNDPGGEAIATAARDGTVNLYFSGAGPHVSQASLNETTAHEFGHLVSFQAENTDASFWTSWERAMEEDAMAVSRYGLTNKLEDFAESYVLYLSGGNRDAATRTRYGHRWTILDRLFRAAP